MTEASNEAQEKKDFEAAFNGEEVEQEVEQEVEAETSENESTEEQDSALEESVSEEASVDSEIAGLSPEALTAIEAKLMSKMEPEILSRVEQKLSGRLRNLEGNFGGMKQKVEMLATAQAAARETQGETPTASQIKEAAKDGEKMQQLREDFPEFAEALDERLNVLSQGDNEELKTKLSAAEKTANSTATELQKLQQIRRLDRHHPDWEDIIQTEQYTNWLYNQPQNVIQAANNSINADDAIAVLNMYKQATKPEQPKTSRSTKRLEDAITPTQGGHRSPSRKTEYEEFEAAFKAARQELNNGYSSI